MKGKLNKGPFTHCKKAPLIDECIIDKLNDAYQKSMNSSSESIDISTSDINKFMYVDPLIKTQQIQKREMFDEDNIKCLLTDEMFNKSDRTRLSNYNKHRISGSKINVSYKFGVGCEEHKLGRLFPEDGIGLQSFRFDIRNPLAKKWYWDTDVENCHYIIAKKYCENYGLVCDYITQYINDRENILLKVSKNRKKAKTELLKVLYLGNIKLYNENYNEVDGEINEEGFEFLINLRKEVENLAIMIWDKYPQYHKLKTGQDKKPIIKKPNPKSSLMSLLFQTEERHILMVWDAFLTFKGRYLAVYIHDGGLVEKLEGETKFPQELLNEGSKVIYETLGYKVKLTQKEIKYDWKPSKPLNAYETIKKEFEEKNFLVGSKLCCIHNDGQMEYMDISKAKVKFAPYVFWDFDIEKGKQVKKKFLDSWIEDKNRKAYERVDFYPYQPLCPNEVYNLFKGFNAEKFKPLDENGNEITLTQEQIDEIVKPIIEHWNYLTNGNSEWIMKWFANLIQTPHIKSQVSPLIRDEGGLLEEGGGTGKNVILEWIGEEIIGIEYINIIGDNKELYSNFNSLYEGKLLNFVEEASGRENHQNTDTLKSKITCKRINVNKKSVAQYTVNDYSRYVFTSNNRNPLPIRQGDRRFAVFDTNPCMRGNTKYFETLINHLNESKTKWAFYLYLKTLKTYDNPIQFQKSIPITNAYREIRLLNAPLHLKWIVYELKNGTLTDDYSSELYKRFINWVEETKEKNDVNVMSQISFGMLLNNAKDCQRYDNDSYTDYKFNDDIGSKNKRKGNIYMKWNYDSLVEGLKKLHLLEPEFKIEQSKEHLCEYCNKNCYTECKCEI